MHVFYYKGTFGFPYFRYKKKLTTETEWGVEKDILLGVPWQIAYADNAYKIPVAKTKGDLGGNKVHAFWLQNPGLWHKIKYSTASDWTNPKYEVSGGVSVRELEVTSISNDIFAVYSFGGAQPFYYYSQYDDVPLSPKNLTITESENSHPYLEWDANNEPDIAKYYVYRKDDYGGGWQYLDQTSATNYEDQTLTYCHATPPSQCADERNFEFYVTAVDLNSHESEPSNIVEARLVGGSPDKISIKNPELDKITDYSLRQNYPNPFNPLTRIDYSIKSAGIVTLKVYDMLGNEVASLVNERKESGEYSVEFNAGNLPSGVYVYQLTAGDFFDMKKLILLK